MSRSAEQTANALHAEVQELEATIDGLRSEMRDLRAMADDLDKFGKWLAAEHHYYAAVDGPVARCLARVIARYGMIEGSS